MSTKFLSLLAGVALLGGVSVANAAEPLTSAQMDTVVASGTFNAAFASARALAIGKKTVTATSTTAVAVQGVGSQSSSKSVAIAF